MALKTGLFNCCCKEMARGAQQIGEGGGREWRRGGKLASPKLLFLKFACLLNSSIYKSYWIWFCASPFLFPVESVMDDGCLGGRPAPRPAVLPVPLYLRRLGPSLPLRGETHVVEGISREIASPGIS